MDYVDQIVGAQIRARRAAMGLSQDELSEDVGISCQQLQKYETGKSRVPASRLSALARALDVEAAFFFFLPEDTTDPVTGGRDDAVFNDQIVDVERAMTLFATIKSDGLRKGLLTIIEVIVSMDADPAELDRHRLRTHKSRGGA